MPFGTALKDCAKIRKPNENTFLTLPFIRNINTFVPVENHTSAYMTIKTQTYSLLLFAVLIGLTSCSNMYHIEGTSSVHTLDGKMLYLKQYSDSGWTMVDSTEVVHGLFTLKGKANSGQMVTLFMDEDPLMPVVLENGNIHITIGTTNLKASGTALNDRLYQFIDHRNQLERNLRDLDRKEARLILEGASIDTIRPQLEKEMQALTQELDNYVKEFITDNYENVLGLKCYSVEEVPDQKVKTAFFKIGQTGYNFI